MNAVPWLQVLGSVAFDLTHPTPEMVSFGTMAAVLARTPRFGGHTEPVDKPIYSVAQHSEEGARAILRDGYGPYIAAVFRLHDGHEYIIGDRPTPVTDSLCAIAVEMRGEWSRRFLMQVFKEQKRRLDAAIYTAAGLPWPIAPDVARIVHHYDLRMCRTERDARLATPPRDWGDAIEAAEPVQGCDLSPWPEAWARDQFLAGCRESRPALGGDYGFGPGARARFVERVDS